MISAIEILIGSTSKSEFWLDYLDLAATSIKSPDHRYLGGRSSINLRWWGSSAGCHQQILSLNGIILFYGILEKRNLFHRRAETRYHNWVSHQGQRLSECEDVWETASSRQRYSICWIRWICNMLPRKKLIKWDDASSQDHKQINTEECAYEAQGEWCCWFSSTIRLGCIKPYITKTSFSSTAASKMKIT